MPSGKRARGEEGEAGLERGRRRRVEERGAGESVGAPRPTSHRTEPTPTDWGSDSPPLQRYAPQPLRREPATVGASGAGEVAELVHYVKWAGGTRGGRERRGTPPFCNLVGRAGRPRDLAGNGGERVEEDAGRGAPGGEPGLSPGRGKQPRVRMLRELLQREGWY